jgi:hypothetical protein
MTLFVTSASFAQIKPEPGYYINNTGERKEVQIRNVAWKNNPTKFEYVADASELKEMRIEDVREFQVASYRYKRFTVNIDRSQLDLNKLGNDKNPVFNEETLFLKVLVDGNYTLYQYEDNNFSRFFVSTGKHEKAEQLVYKEYISDHTYISENNLFRQQLFTLMNSGQMKKQDFSNLSYKKESLVALFTKANQSEGAESKDLSTGQNHSSVNLKISANVAFASISMQYEMQDIDFQQSKVVFGAGLEAEYVMPFNNNKWSIFVNPSYSSVKANKENDGVQTEVDYSFIEIPAGLRHYMFLGPKQRLFVDAGYTLALKSNARISYGGSEFIVRSTSNLFAGIGFSSGKMSVEARANFNRPLVEHPVWRVNYTSISIVAAYKIL